MKVVLIVLAVLVALFLGALLVAALTPPEFSVRGTAVIAAPADSLWARLATPRTWERWSAWTTRADSTLRTTYEGPETGTGAVMNFTAKHLGTGSMRIVEAVPGRDVRYDLGLAGTGMVVHGHVTLEPGAEGTRITWVDSGTMGNALLLRLLKPMLGRSMGAAYDTCFAGLRRELAAPR